MAAQEEQPQLQGADHGAALHFTVPPRISFQVTAGPCEGATLVPKGYSFSVGRTKASRLHIKDPSVSERHAEVSWDGSAWQVKDLGSSNGTKVDGVRVQPMGEHRSWHAGVGAVDARARSVCTQPAARVPHRTRLHTRPCVRRRCCRAA